MDSAGNHVRIKTDNVGVMDHCNRPEIAEESCQVMNRTSCGTDITGSWPMGHSIT
jgi:hypothetical protein